MKRIAILTAGGDTPAMNATIHGAVTRANQLKIEMIGLMGGFNSLFDPQMPHVRLNPLFSNIPELDPTKGGTVLGSSRRYIDPRDIDQLDIICSRLRRLKVEGLICVGGDGTLNGLQPLCDRIPTVLAPKTIDNDLGLNYPRESDKWLRVEDTNAPEGFTYTRTDVATVIEDEDFPLDQMINYATPGYATAVYVSASGVERVRTTAESHRRVAIIEVMGRHSGYIALGSAYGQPDLILIPEYPVNADRLAERVMEIYDIQRNVVIVCGEGVVDESGEVLGASRTSTDPAGNVMLSGAAERLRQLLIDRIGDDFFLRQNRNDSARSAIFTRKVGHTQRGGRPLAFDRYYAAQLGGKAVDMLMEGQNNSVAVLQWDAKKGFYVGSFHGNQFRDRWGTIHARSVHTSFYDGRRMLPSSVGINYLLPIFTNAIGSDDVEYVRQTLFDSGNLFRSYHSVNTDIAKRIEYLYEK
jgi:6-phosphofructokinase 1